jgi:hypothetical protein
MQGRDCNVRLHVCQSFLMPLNILTQPQLRPLSPSSPAASVPVFVSVSLPAPFLRRPGKYKVSVSEYAGFLTRISEFDLWTQAPIGDSESCPSRIPGHKVLNLKHGRWNGRPLVQSRTKRRTERAGEAGKDGTAIV